MTKRVAHTTHVRGGESILKELGRLLKFVSGTPGIPSGDVKWSTSWLTCQRNHHVNKRSEATDEMEHTMSKKSLTPMACMLIL